VPANYLTGYAPTNMLAYGTQAAPLDSFAVDGRTGNKTTNKDLPAWLRAIGMKGDAYAGGMLKPEIRYGFAYKNGKIHFADGTSFDAKKNKGGTYTYTGADGNPVTYSPTDEQNSYNKKYKASTSNQSFLDKATNAVKFELDHGQQILKGVWDHPQQAIFGVDPLGTKIGNAVTGDNAKPQVDQLGGARGDRYADYTARTGNATGFAKPLQGAAHVIAAAFGAQGLGNAAGNIAGRFGSAPTGNDLGVFSNGGADGMGSVGGGNAGRLASSGVIANGAGTGGTTAGALGSASGGLSSLGGGGAGSGANMGWGDWVNLAGQLYGAYSQGQGAKNASNAEQAGIQAGIGEQRREFDLARGDQMPWLEAGRNALGRLNDPNGYTASPDYNYVRNEALRGVEGSAAARGGLYSGNTMRALQDRAAGVASQDYGNWFNRQASLAGVGQASAQSLGSLGQQNSTNVSNLLNQQGNARASGIEGQTNALTGGISDFLSWYNRRRQGGG
jgi:hypothetical protein